AANRKVELSPDNVKTIRPGHAALSPPPTAVDPCPAVPARHPMTADPHGAGIRWHDVSSGDPDPLDAIPRPIAGLPDITGRGCWRHRLDYGGRRRYPDPEPDPGERRSCRCKQQARHEGEGEDSPSAHVVASC